MTDPEKERQRTNLKSLRYQRKNAEKVVRKRRDNKRELIKYKGGKCEICGYNKDYLTTYDFHHIDPNNKSFGLSRSMSKSFDSLKKEVDKCQLLCRNCHSEIHENENRDKILLSIEKLKSSSDDDLRKMAASKKEVKWLECEHCCTKYKRRYTEQRFCSRSCRIEFFSK